MLTCYSHAHTHTVATFCLISGRTQTLVCARAHTHTFTLMHVYSMLYTQASHCSTCADIHLHTHIYAQACVLNTEAFHCRTRADICLHTHLCSCMFAKHTSFTLQHACRQLFTHTHHAHACVLNTPASHCSTRADIHLHTHIYAQACVLNTEASYCSTRADICSHTHLCSGMCAKHTSFSLQHPCRHLFTHTLRSCMFAKHTSFTLQDACRHLFTHTLTLMHVC